MLHAYEHYITKRLIKMASKSKFFQDIFKSSLPLGYGMVGEIIWQGEDYIVDSTACFMAMEPLYKIDLIKMNQRSDGSYDTKAVWIPTVQSLFLHRYIRDLWEFIEYVYDSDELFVAESPNVIVDYWRIFDNINELVVAYVMFTMQNMIWNDRKEQWEPVNQ